MRLITRFILLTAFAASLSIVSASGVPADSPIKHVVVVMLENRAFDHMCGWLNQWGVPVDGLTGKEYNIANGTRYYVNDTCPYVHPFDPLHSLEHTTAEVMGVGKSYEDPEPMDGFAELHMLHHFPQFWTVMHGFAPDRVPAISTLARDFAVFDRYYASLPGPTYPNRMFVGSGTSHGHDTQDGYLLQGVPQRTLYNVLGDNNISWGVYFSDVPDTVLFDQLRTLDNLRHLHFIDAFKKDAADGTLPAFSWVTPKFFPIFGPASDQHPDHDVVIGEEFIADIYEAVRNGKNWNDTLFIVTYDEHGGFWDHVPPPEQFVPNPDGINSTSGFDFTRLGLRVCTVMASPRIAKGSVVHEARDAPHKRYEHSSIYATLRALWNISEELTNRTAFAASFDHVVTLAEPRTDCPTTIPTPKVSATLRKTLEMEQGLRPPNDLQKDLFAMMEKALNLGVTQGKDYPNQQLMGHKIRQMVELFLSRTGREVF